jgi:uncharacterized protein YkwD
MVRLATFAIATASFVAGLSNAPVAAVFQLGSSGRVMWDSNCDFSGNDYRSLTGISEICGDVCATDPACTHWTWNTYSGGTCWFKKGTPSTKSSSWGALCGYVVSRSTATTTTSSSGLSVSDMADMLGRINAFRAQNGLGALSIDYKLVKAALAHSQDQASRCLMTHTGAIKAQGYSFSMAAENVAAGQTTVADVMTSWWNSPSHRANILNKDVVNVGFAVATNGACSNYKTYWTQDFGRPLY